MIRQSTRNVILVLVFVLGLTGTYMLVRSTEAESDREAGEITDVRARFVVEAVRLSVQGAMDDAAASAGLFIASERVSDAEFMRFTARLDPDPGILGIARVAIGDESDASPGGTSGDWFQFDRHGERIPAAPAPRYLVSQFVPNGDYGLDLIGFDAGSDPAWAEALDRAIDGDRVVVSRLTQLFGAADDWGFLAVSPVVEDEAVSGFAISIVRLEDLVGGELAESLAEVVSWDVSDVTGLGADLVTTDPLRRSTVIRVGSRDWSVGVVPTDAARSSLTATDTQRLVVLGVLLTILLLAAANLTIGFMTERRERRHLQDSARDRDEFLSAISHELRTPLTTILGMAAILDESIDGNDEVSEHSRLLVQESEVLARLVDDLLLLGRLETGSVPVRPAAVDIAAETRSVAEELATDGVPVTVVGAGWAITDPMWVRQILRQLVSNAIRHGGSKVTVEVVDTDCILVQVTDDGPGLPDDRARHVFATPRGSRETPGGPSTLGVGLRSARRLATLLGGDLRYRRFGNLTVFELALEKGEPIRREAYRVSEAAA